MARTSRIRVQVQVDRLPDVTDGSDFVQLGLRVSAVIQPKTGQTDGAINDDDDRILPWRWRDHDVTTTDRWNPHLATSWKIWRLRNGSATPQEVPSAQVNVLDRHDTGFDTFDLAKFGNRVEREVKEIRETFGPRQAFEIPAQEGVLSGRTAFGLAESLTSLPNPVPVAMNVWTAAWIKKGDLAVFDKDDRFLAVPKFAVVDAVYDPPTTLTLGADGVWTADMTAALNGADALEATAAVHLSLGMSKLEIGAGKEERMIDLSKLLIRARDNQQFESGDWIASAGLRIAEAIDPAARAMAVLDKTIDAWVSANPRQRRQALIDDAVNGPDLLRKALDKLHLPVLARRARRSEATTAPAASFLQALTERNVALWPAVVPILFAQAGGEADQPPKIEGKFHATSAARLLGAAGVPPSPERAPAEEKLPLLDSPAGFVDWLLGHWLSVPDKPEPAKKFVFQQSVQLIERDSAGLVTARVNPAGVMSFARIPRPESGSLEIVLPLRLSTPTTVPAKVTVTFQVLGTRESASLAVELKYQANAKLTFGVVGGTTKTVDTPASAILAFKVTILPNAVPALKLELVPGDKPAEAIDFTGDPAPLLLSGPVSITVDSPDQPLVATIDTSRSSLPAVERDPLVRQAQALRGALSFAYASSFVPPLLQGWAPIDGTTSPNVEKRLAERLSLAAKKFIDDPFVKQFDTAMAGLPAPLLELFQSLQTAAKTDAGLLIEAVVPPSLDEGDRLTEDALPLAFLVAQLQDFDPEEDLWGRLAGVGVLISRDHEVDADNWWSLNAATLHTSEILNNARAPLGESNAVRTVGGGTWQMASKVDPVPLNISEVGGVRTGLLKYENHSIVGEMQGTPQLAGQGTTARRPEAFFFPTSKFPARDFTRMPALTFGREYHILPYLIGHGGALPPILRAKPLNPVKHGDLSAKDTFAVKVDDAGPAGDHYVYKRKTEYLRTVPVSAPRVADSQWPGTFQGVDPLADELPLRPAPITVRPGDEARFFIDQQRLTGLLAARASAIRIDVGQIDVPHGSDNARLEIRFESRDDPDPALSAKVDVSKLVAAVTGAPFGLRIEASDQATTKVRALKRLDGVHADDEPEQTEPLTGIAIERKGDVASWTSLYVIVRVTGAPLDVEPPTVRWGTLSGDEFVLDGDRPVLPPELAHASRKVGMLDGIKTGAQTGARQFSLTLRRPATSVSTYERWINWPTGATGLADENTIREAIHQARERVTTLGKGDRSLDDPAVETLFVEVNQVFPRRIGRAIDVGGTPVSGLVRMKNPLSGNVEEIVGLKDGAVSSRDFASIVAGVDLTSKPGTTEEGRTAGTLDSTKGKLTLRLTPGCIYEVRVYAAIPPSQPLLAPKSTDERFSPPVRASFRDVRDNGGNVLWRLGTPLTLTLEVATEIMPECWPRDGVVHDPDTTHPDFTKPGFAISVQRPPRVMEDRATIRLVPEHIGPPIVDGTRQPSLSYAALRYANRAALLHQRWSWRGRPMPELLLDSASLGTEEERIDLTSKLNGFIDAAFLGRSDDDIGAVREVSFGRAHASGGKPVMEQPKTQGSRPVLLEHDLDRRAGTHLWRFALRLTSRYAAMRSNHPALIRFSHVQKESERTQWWPVVVPDRVDPDRTPRAVARPGLLVVVPLTETEMTAGSVPPLLAVFNQELFPNFNVTDGVEAVVDVARHPLPGAKRIDEALFGTTFEEKWKAVRDARIALRPLEDELAQAVRVGSLASSTAQGDAKTKRDNALHALDDAEIKFKMEQFAAGAAGLVTQWKDVRVQVKTALDNATTQEEKDRLQKRLDQIDLTIVQVQAQADEAKLHPVAIAGRPIDPHTKYLQEMAPDPIRDASPAADRPVAVRVDGPIGYTFDEAVEAGRFDHSGLLVSPVAEVTRPGTFVKLRFRRLEAPGFLVATDPGVTASPDKSAPLDQPMDSIPAGGARFLIENPSAGKERPAGVADDVHLFHTVHEGVAFDLADLDALGKAQVRFSLSKPSDAFVPCVPANANPGAFTAVDARVEGADDARKIVLAASTYLGTSAEWSLPLPAGATARLQAIVSLRPRPLNLQDKAEKKKFVPVADVSMRMRIDREERDSLRRPQENAWLSVLCMPLTTLTLTEEQKFTDLVAVQVCPDAPQPLPVAVTPLRLSDFTPSVWCQFAAAMSRLRVVAKTESQRDIDEVIDVRQLTVTRSGKDNFMLGLAGLPAGETLQSLTLHTEGEPEAAAQIEEPLYAVVTRFVHDAFDRLRERVIGIHPLVEKSLAFGARLWPEAKAEDYDEGMSGRVRFLRLVRGKTRDHGGFERQRREFPKDFFGQQTSEALDAEPLDAAGMVMGISTPIEWGKE